MLRSAAGGVPRQAAPTVLGGLAALALYVVVGVLPLLWLFLALQVCCHGLDTTRVQ
jgi:hypothetical protein